MTSWIDTLEMLTMGNSSVVLFCTATTGLHKTDKLLAISYVLWDGDRKGKHETLYLEAPDDVLHPGMQYHQISPDLMHANGLPVEEFRKRVMADVEGRIAFTYNVGFQLRALLEMDGGVFPVEPGIMLDLPLWLKAAESRKYFMVDAPIEKAENQIANGISVPPWKRVLDNRGIASTPPPGMVPVSYNALCLSQLYEAIIEQPPSIELAVK